MVYGERLGSVGVEGGSAAMLVEGGSDTGVKEHAEEGRRRGGLPLDRTVLSSTSPLVERGGWGASLVLGGVVAEGLGLFCRVKARLVLSLDASSGVAVAAVGETVSVGATRGGEE